MTDKGKETGRECGFSVEITWGPRCEPMMEEDGVGLAHGWHDRHVNKVVASILLLCRRRECAVSLSPRGR